MGHEGESARNAFLVTGPADTGKHLSLCAAAEELARRGVFVSGDISWMDLSLYPTAAEEKLFLQDLYMALAAKGDIVVFEHYERCQPAFLTVLSIWCSGAKARWPERYVLQNGRLVDAGNALVTDAVGALTPRGKYLVLLSEAPVAKLADSFGAPFVSALGDICETAALTPESLSAVAKAEFDKAGCPRAKRRWASPSQPGMRHCSCRRKQRTRQGRAGRAGILGPRLPRAGPVPAGTRRRTQSRRAGRSGRPPDCRLRRRPGGSALPASWKLPRRGGSCKGRIGRHRRPCSRKGIRTQFEDNFAVQARRKAAGLKTASVSMHMIFTGNPAQAKRPLPGW